MHFYITISYFLIKKNRQKMYFLKNKLDKINFYKFVKINLDEKNCRGQNVHTYCQYNMYVEIYNFVISS